MTVPGAQALARCIAERRQLADDLARARTALAAATGHPHADHPYVGRRSLTGTLITPQDVQRLLDEETIDHAWRAAIDDTEQVEP